MIDCPVELMPRNCKAAIKSAEANGWKWKCTLSGGFLDGEVEVVWAVLLRCWKPGVDRLCGRWEGSTKTTLGWHSGWRYPNPRMLGWTEFHDLIKGSPEKPLTPKAQASLDQEVSEHLAAITALRPIGWPIRVHASGNNWREKDGTWVADHASQCEGKYRVGLFWMPCPNPAVKDGVLCVGPCGE